MAGLVNIVFIFGGETHNLSLQVPSYLNLLSVLVKKLIIKFGYVYRPNYGLFITMSYTSVG